MTDTTPESAPFSRSPAASAAPSPATPENPTPDAATNPGRDSASGRFVVGNGGGPGNPYARETARLRQEFRACSKPGDMQRVHDAIIAAAEKGNVSAQRLYLQYRIAPPIKPEDPDRVDGHEYQVNKDASEMYDNLHGILKPDAATTLRQARVMRPLLGSIASNQISDMFLNPEKYRPKVPDISILDQPAPTANGPISAELSANMAAASAALDALAGGKTPRPPSPDGSNGGGGKAKGRMDGPPSPIGPIGNEEAANLSLLANARPSANGKKRHAPGLRR